MISAIVPIKRDSQRVEYKNFREINGKPLFYWILSSLNSSDYIDEIIINIDDEYIEEELTRYFDFLKFVYRPDNLKGNEVSMNKIIDSMLDDCKNESIIQTHTTNPFLKVSTIDSVLKEHLNKGRNYFTVTKIQERLYDSYGIPVNHIMDELVQTQDLDPIYIENSGFYIFTKESFKKNKNRISKDSKMFETKFPENIDIDNESDFKVAEILFQENL
tara:strand:- start:1011 stop:1661 length:651 start_codon:yes stop_codon:yes gene_type:complete